MSLGVGTQVLNLLGVRRDDASVSGQGIGHDGHGHAHGFLVGLLIPSHD